MKSVLFSGSTPAAIQSATLSMPLATISFVSAYSLVKRVPVGDEVEAVEAILQLDPVAQRAHQVAEMKFSRRAHPRHDAFGHHDSSRKARKLMDGRIR